MKNYIAVAALLAAGTAFANAESKVVTETLIKEDGWDMSSRNSRPTWVQDTSEGTLTLENSNWSQAAATYDFAENIDLLSFSVKVTRASSSAGFSFALVGNNTVVVVGTDPYTSGTLYYGTSSSLDKRCYYINDDGWNNDGGVSVSGTSWLDGIFNYNATATLSGTTSVNEDGETVLTLSASSTANGSGSGSKEFVLGKDFLLDKIIIGGDGDNNAANWTVSDLSVSYEKAVAPEPSAFGLLAGLGALALVASRRRRK